MKAILAIMGAAAVMAVMTGCNKEQSASNAPQPGDSETKVQAVAPVEGSGAKVETAPAEGSDMKHEGSGTK